MIGDVLDYLWARNKLLEEIAPTLSENGDEGGVLTRIEDLSHRLVEYVSQDEYDEMRASLMHAREVAYWNEWLSEYVKSGESGTVGDNSRIAGAITSFAEFRFPPANR